MKYVAIGDLLDKHPLEDVFVDFKFDITDVSRVHSDKPTMVARFYGWDKVKSHWPGLGFSIYDPSCCGAPGHDHGQSGTTAGWTSWHNFI